MATQIGSIVLAGDIIEMPAENKNNKSKIILGPGLRVSSGKAIAITSGILEKKEPNTYWINYYQKRYIPVKGECVIGVVTNKAGDIFKVDIGSSEQASISYLAFEGSTKKNRPDVQVGDLIFGKLLISSRDMEPELVCVNPYGKKEKLGVLPSDGFLFTCSLNLARKILDSKNNLIRKIGQELPHEIAIGMNGKIWIRAKTIKHSIAICNVILASEHISDDQNDYICEQIFKKLRII